ncbi:hypothetical protein Nos7524_5285 [Nostoc sp. PCC 7524]|nr:hypothetical protein Nos7524_5285 [Nostoc sp. PCC 7524]
MYFTLQEFLSRCHGNLLNNHKNSLEIAKTSNQGKFILNKQRLSNKFQRTSKLKLI